MILGLQRLPLLEPASFIFLTFKDSKKVVRVLGGGDPSKQVQGYEHTRIHSQWGDAFQHQLTPAVLEATMADDGKRLPVLDVV